MPPIHPPETITIESATLYCDGGDGDLGHPRVYLTMTKDGSVDCPYCGRHFILAPHAQRTASGH